MHYVIIDEELMKQEIDWMKRSYKWESCTRTGNYSITIDFSFVCHLFVDKIFQKGGMQKNVYVGWVLLK